MLQEGTVLAGRFRVLQSVAQGGMAILYRGHDLRADAPIAIKVLKPDFAGRPEGVERLRHEAYVLSHLQHPNIVRYVDFQTVNGLPYLVMAWAPGETLKQQLAARAGPYAVDQVSGLARALCDAIAHMAARGVIHRDIKPANILITPDGQPLLIDFGIAMLRATAEKDPLARTPAGTASYMAPEQLAGQHVDTRADIYALGTILFELLTLARPFADVERAATTDLRRQRLTEAKTTRDAPSIARYRPDLPPTAVAAVDGALARHPDARWPTAAALWSAWGAADEPSPAVARQPSRRRALALIVAASVILFGGALALLGGSVVGAPKPPICQPLTLPDDVLWTTCVDSALYNAGRLRLEMIWKVALPPGEKRRKLSDAGNPNMYLADRDGRKYPQIAAGGDAIGEIDLEGERTLHGWFEFAMPAKPSAPLIFVDDDMHLRILFGLR